MFSLVEVGIGMGSDMASSGLGGLGATMASAIILGLELGSCSELLLLPFFLDSVILLLSLGEGLLS